MERFKNDIAAQELFKLHGAFSLGIPSESPHLAVLSECIFVEDKSGDIERIGITRDCIVFYNRDYIKTLSDYDLLFFLFHITSHVVSRCWKYQGNRKNKEWEAACDVEANVCCLGAYGIYGVEGSHALTELHYEHNSLDVSKKLLIGSQWIDYISSEKSRADLKNNLYIYESYVRDTGLPSSKYYSNARFVYSYLRAKSNRYRSYSDRIIFPQHIINAVTDDNLDAVSDFLKDRTQFLKKDNDIDIINVSESELNAILFRTRDGSFRGEYISALAEGDNRSGSSLHIKWDKIISDIENVASGNKIGGMHDYSGSAFSKREYGDFLTPDMIGGKTSKLCIIIDCSSSVHLADLVAAREQVEVILNLGIPSVDVIYCDTKARCFFDIGDIEDLPLIRGNSTNMVEGLRVAFESEKNYDLVVVISDGDTQYPDYDDFPATRYMFVIVQNNSSLKRSQIPDHVPVTYIERGKTADEDILWN